MRRACTAALLIVLAASTLHADVSLVERKALNKSGKSKGPGHRTSATGSQSLIDSEGLQFFINTNITFTTSSSASAAASEASYTHSVAASTLNGGTTSSRLNDAYDGYQSICLVLNNTFGGACETGNANFVMYVKNGAPPTSECPGPLTRVNRQLVFPVQTVGNIQVYRKVFVPDNDHFARWLNYFTNTGTTPQTVTMQTGNNLGSDNNTIITGSSNTGTGTPNTTDTWVTTFQNFSGTTTSDPRLGHVLWGSGAAVGLSGIFFENGNDNPYWAYTFTVNPGQTRIIMNFGVGEASKAAAAAQSAALVSLPSTATQCMTTAELAEVANFAAAEPIAEVPTLSRTALAALVVLLAVTAAFRLRRRRATA